MKRISLLSRKGGVGKSLSTMAIAQILSSRHRVVVLDLDPEGTTKTWAGNAAHAGIDLPFQVLGPVEIVGVTDIDYLVIDTPPNDPKTLAATAKQSDVILIPMQPGPQEMDRLEGTMNILRDGNFKKGAQYGIILNFVEHDNLSRMMPEALDQLGYPLVAQVKRTVEYRRSYGKLIPYELLEPFRMALKEVNVL